MAKKEQTTINIDGKEYTEDQLTDQQKIIINHINDLDRKMGSVKFNLDQMAVGRDAFVNILKQSLQEVEETEEAA
jgi:hypothetical protein